MTGLLEEEFLLRGHSVSDGRVTEGGLLGMVEIFEEGIQ